MPDHIGTNPRQSAKIAYCGMAAALSVAMMLLGGLFPPMVYTVPIFCGAVLLPVMLEFGAKTAWTTYLAVSILALVLGFDKEAAFFYIFTGYYPILKWRMDRLKPAWKRVGAKLLLFSIAIGAMYGLLALIFPMGDFLRGFKEMGVAFTAAFALAFNVLMLLYDRMLAPLAERYLERIRPKLHFLKR